MDMETELNELFDRWLMDNCKEDIHCEEDLIKMSENGYRHDEFADEVKKNL